MKKIFFYITILLAFLSATNIYATDVKAAKGFDRPQLTIQSHQSLVQKSENSSFDIDVLELIEEVSDETDETDDSEEGNSSFAAPNFHNFYLVYNRFPTFLSKKTPDNTHSFSRSLPIFIFIRVLRL